MKEHFLSLIDERATLKLGAMLAAASCHHAIVIALFGDLGAGKTTFSRGFIQALGYTGKVKSPTYTLVESYSLFPKTIHHFDFYRVSDPQELEWIGIRDYFNEQAICLIEWPDKGISVLPEADLELHFIYQGQKRDVQLVALSDQGVDSLKHFIDLLQNPKNDVTGILR
ncbi:tRNA (adenosine(37)-N6)-threonylcarbamoyltransferase complex ATPase subunit type 1 TsaE [Candidatus Williamhamiltonella defendens]|uniref:tRNA threonylcarbamoyladenosine biosynthesis protein TsaE n=1 Tax=Candidatus Williamhamiltonella defendens TaxID=138072 RepID=A0A2D3TBR5_9ENTR|nr:tRNA (adenosine(37)-N6)-threonylcarbamoyltransferase complex ATPase subunit type 1 TsaE [Candidatus Hamiltonella defensa]ATW33236.1 tRNA (adenosine(37)-N6)-threonylcarbamoyltransferase complex ATPase subunit type 1 TsaE [Candidatus Hamiltonella defensa]AYB49856.1 tRNA (adenosine(37)-N6)-threonylcarbamoyltransferase complex ATPase subunit type 1 TsaE [Candidatus Hamiltonella defensa]